MDTSVRLRTAAGGALKIAPPVSANISQLWPTATTVTSLRKAILDCAHQATATEPTDTDARLHCFIAKLSGTMEGLGERELDAALWNLMTSHRQPLAPTLGEPAPSDVQLGMVWWNGLTEERRGYWLSKAGSAVPYAAWIAFRAAEDDLALEG